MNRLLTVNRKIKLGVSTGKVILTTGSSSSTSRDFFAKFCREINIKEDIIEDLFFDNLPLIYFFLRLVIVLQIKQVVTILLALVFSVADLAKVI
jgi:hypothetical protein